MNMWKHGKYIDTWSIVHLLSGVALGSGLYFLGYDFPSSFALSLAILLVWESFEWITNIIEPSINVAIDIIIGMTGFGLMASLHHFGKFDFNMSIFSLILASVIILSIWGFFDFLKRGYR
jgi:hypothetical protein